MSVATAVPMPPTRAQAALLAVRHAAGEDLEPLGAAALDEDIDVLLRISDTAQAEAARRLRRREQLPEPPADGASSSVAWLSWRCRMTPGRAADLVCVSRRLADLPETARDRKSTRLNSSHVA